MRTYIIRGINSAMSFEQPPTEDDIQQALDEVARLLAPNNTIVVDLSIDDHDFEVECDECGMHPDDCECDDDPEESANGPE